MHDELAAILAAAAAAGIEVMPLKGALLTTLPGARATAAGRWPISTCSSSRPTGSAWARCSRGSATAPDPEANPHPTHDVFVDPGGGRVVSSAGEHPDNPRRVEVHVEVKRHLWGWVDDDDLTEALWRGARAGEVLGQPASLPRAATLFAHLAIHASSDLLSRSRPARPMARPGVCGAARRRSCDVPHPRLAYPCLRLAKRALPDAMAAARRLGALTEHVPARLARWAATVPLDRRCGLTAGRPPTEPSESRRAMGALATRPLASRGRLRRRRRSPWHGALRADRHRPDEAPRRRLTSVS